VKQRNTDGREMVMSNAMARVTAEVIGQDQDVYVARHISAREVGSGARRAPNSNRIECHDKSMTRQGRQDADRYVYSMMKQEDMARDRAMTCYSKKRTWT